MKSCLVLCCFPRQVDNLAQHLDVRAAREVILVLLPFHLGVVLVHTTTPCTLEIAAPRIAVKAVL
jgi:hypothetical protein